MAESTAAILSVTSAISSGPSPSPPSLVALRRSRRFRLAPVTARRVTALATVQQQRDAHGSEPSPSRAAAAPAPAPTSSDSPKARISGAGDGHASAAPRPTWPPVASKADEALDVSSACAKAALRPAQPLPRPTWPLVEQTKADEVFEALGITPWSGDASPTSAMASSLADHDHDELYLSATTGSRDFTALGISTKNGADIISSYIADCDPVRLVVRGSSSSSSLMLQFRTAAPAPHVPTPPSSSDGPTPPQYDVFNDDLLMVELDDADACFVDVRKSERCDSDAGYGNDDDGLLVDHVPARA
jgi:hypothetical protein